VNDSFDKLRTGRTVAVSLKIPDNEAYTTLVALQRLGVPVKRVERSVIYRLRNGEEDPPINPNKHRLVVLEKSAPRSGELWIEEIDRGPSRAIAWRLVVEDGKPASREVLRAAAERLLCNPAIERAVY
jgi:phosphoribosylformylglycinamidine (FGAM) synthase PurS component